MRLAILRQNPWGLGGAETTVRHLAQGLAAAGHEVTLYGAGKPPAGAAALPPNLRYQPVPVWGGKTARLLSYAVNVRRLLQSHPEQLVFSLERTFRQHVYRAGDGCHREWLRRRALVSGPGQRLGQSLNLFHLVMLRLEQHLFQEPGLLRVIANSRQVQEEIGRHYHLKPERLRVIYNGLEHEHFHPCPEPARDSLRRELGAPPGARPVLFLGSGFERKGLSYILQAFAALKDGTAWLWVVGKGPPSFGRLAARLGLAGRVVFWGPQSEVSRFYQAAQVLVLPTIYDPCSNVVLEALACGCPVVTTAANGAAEFIAPGENGYVIANPADQAALTQALQQGLDLSQDPRARLAAQAGVAHLSWQTTVARTLEVLQEAAALVR